MEAQELIDEASTEDKKEMFYPVLFKQELADRNIIKVCKEMKL